MSDSSETAEDGASKIEYDSNGVSLDGKTFVKYLGGKDAKKFAVPSGVTAIGMAAFCDCSSLRSVVLPGGVTRIGYNAFRGCSALESVVLSNELDT
ncbi:MAG: leucine-rich repeat protein, partial [Thermoguttaceae bacterium]|nr:leucine-rich repeat protein [Thermoguttaceae bacterium]